MDGLFRDLLARSYNAGVKSIDYIAESPMGFDKSFNPMYWVRIDDQPGWLTQIAREQQKDMPRDCNNVAVHFKDLAMVSLVYQQH